MPEIHLGPFRLVEKLGVGGMGEVWRGTHVRQDAPVAIKVLTAERVRQQRAVLAFHNEAQAVAALDHAAVIWLLEIGEVDRSTESASHGLLVEGSPYLVMELASGGSLQGYGRRMEWAWLKRTLLQVLDGLAHAHARGLVHKDIKPANLLICTPSDLRPGLKITDFGIAHATEGHSLTGERERTITGSPYYMAPEQFAGRWRDYGPWTDLYALGICAFEWAVGEQPFKRETLREMALAHRRAPIPPLPDSVDVPEGFDRWLAKMLAKRPADRFETAADAAYALIGLGDTETVGATRRAGQTQSHEPVMLETMGLDDTAALTAIAPLERPPEDSAATRALAPSETGPTRIVLGSTIPVEADREGSPVPELDAPTPTFPLPPLPKTWRRKGMVRPSPRLVGAGLQLFGLRPIRFVGRSRERDQLWRALREVGQDARAQAVVVRGASGTGKSRLVDWLCGRAMEVGAARCLSATHGPIPGPTDGLERMVALRLNAAGLSRTRAFERIQMSLRPMGLGTYEAKALTEMSRGSSEDDDSPPLVRFETPADRWTIIGRLIEADALTRPVVLWIDDAQWGADATEFAAWMLDRAVESSMRLLILLTVREEALTDREREAVLIDELEQRERCQTIRLGPLSSRDHAQLVREMLGLEGQLVAQVVERTAGNPLFATQLVGDWVDRGILIPGRHGFELSDVVAIDLPVSIQDVWDGRIASFMRHRPPSSVRALELAAALGQDIDAGEWIEACARAGVKVHQLLVADLTAAGLAHQKPDGWAFVHGMLRECIEHRSRESRRWRDHNRTCADMIRDRYDVTAPGVAERLGSHLFEAGDFDEAEGWLLEGARRAEQASEFSQAQFLLQRHSEALRRAGRPIGSDRRWGVNQIRRASVSIAQGDFDVAGELCREALAAAEYHEWDGVAAGALEQLGSIARQQSDLLRAEELLASAVERRRGEDDPTGLAQSLRGLAWVHVLRGELGAATRGIEEAMQIFEDDGDRHGVAKCLRSLGDVYRNLDDMETSEAYFERAREIFEELGSPRGVSECVHGIAETMRLRGDLDGAEKRYRESIELDLAVGARRPVIAWLNLGLCLIDREDFAAAQETLIEVLAEFRRKGQTGYSGCAHACLLPCAAGLADWQSFDAHLSGAVDALKGSGLVDPDIAGPAQRAAELAGAQGQPERARAAYRLALEQWRRLGNTPRADEVEGRLKSLDRALRRS